MHHVLEKPEVSPMRTLVISVPGSIPKELSPNWQPSGISPQAYRGLRARAITEFKNRVYLAAVDARNKWDHAHAQPWQPLAQATLDVTIIKRGRQMDTDNLIASLKAIDMLTMPKPPRRKADAMGIGLTPGKAGASILKDDRPGCLTWGEVEQRKPEKDEWEPMIILTVKGEG